MWVRVGGPLYLGVIFALHRYPCADPRVGYLAGQCGALALTNHNPSLSVLIDDVVLGNRSALFLQIAWWVVVRERKNREKLKFRVWKNVFPADVLNSSHDSLRVPSLLPPLPSLTLSSPPPPLPRFMKDKKGYCRAKGSRETKKGEREGDREMLILFHLCSILIVG